MSELSLRQPTGSAKTKAAKKLKLWETRWARSTERPVDRSFSSGIHITRLSKLRPAKVAV